MALAERLYRTMTHLDPEEGDVLWEELEPQQHEFYRNIVRAMMRDRESVALAAKLPTP